MKKIFLIILILLALVGCKGSNNGLSDGVNNLEKNKECHNFKENLEKEFKKKESDGMTEYLDSMFYYPKTNSCAYVSTIIFYDKIDGKFVFKNMKLRFFDYFTRELIAEAKGSENIFQFKKRILRK